MPVAAQDAQESTSKLLIGQRVAERVDGTVEIAQPVGYVVVGYVVGDVGNSTERRRLARTEANQQRQHVPRGPTDDESAQDDSDGSQRLSRSVLLLAGAGTRYRRFLLRTPLNT